MTNQIITQADYVAALEERRRLWLKPRGPGTPDGERFDRLVGLMEAYESKRDGRRTQETLRFTPYQLDTLRTEGVTEIQIAALVKILPLCKIMIRDAPTLRAVRARLDAISAAVRDIRNLLAPPSMPDKLLAHIEALNRIQKASFDLHGGGDCGEIDMCRALLPKLDLLIDKALIDLGATKRHPNSAAAGPIKLIDDALALGWAQTTKELFQVGGEDRLPLNISPGRNIKFMVVVNTVYEVINGQPVPEPEKAIRAYMAYRRRRRKQLTMHRNAMTPDDPEEGCPHISEQFGKL